MARRLLVRLFVLFVVLWFVLPYWSLVSKSREHRRDLTAGCTLREGHVVRLRVSRERWPRVADHIADAQAGRTWDGASWPRRLEVYRPHADDRRDTAMRLAQLEARPGMARDEYPPAFLRSGKAADVRLVPRGENSSQGAWMGNRLRGYCDGQPVALIVVG